MERVLKFRAWHKTKNKMYEVTRIEFEVQYGMAPGDLANLVLPKDGSEYYREGENVELLQFTGLKDKHGREVYEGDIYRNLDNGRIGKLYYLNGPGGYTLYCRENNADGSPHNMLPFMQLDTTNFEVIGNLYETPDLLLR